MREVRFDIPAPEMRRRRGLPRQPSAEMRACLTLPPANGATASIALPALAREVASEAHNRVSKLIYNYMARHPELPHKFVMRGLIEDGKIVVRVWRVDEEKSNDQEDL